MRARKARSRRTRRRRVRGAHPRSESRSGQKCRGLPAPKRQRSQWNARRRSRRRSPPFRAEPPIRICDRRAPPRLSGLIMSPSRTRFVCTRWPSEDARPRARPRAAKPALFGPHPGVQSERLEQQQGVVTVGVASKELSMAPRSQARVGGRQDGLVRGSGDWRRRADDCKVVGVRRGSFAPSSSRYFSRDRMTSRG